MTVIIPQHSRCIIGGSDIKRRDGSMDKKCRYLDKAPQDPVCKASMTSLSPSIFELNIYCSTPEHYRCPLLLARSLRDGYRESVVKAGAVLSR